MDDGPPRKRGCQEETFHGTNFLYIRGPPYLLYFRILQSFRRPYGSNEAGGPRSVALGD
jgi:hypothetical protein